MNRHQRLIRFIDEVWNKGSVATAVELIAPTYAIRHDPGDPWDGQTLDREGFVARLQQSRAPFPDQTFTILTMTGSGDALVITWTWQATHLGALGPFAATGRTIRMSGATVYTFDADDLLTGHWQVTDRLGVYQQLQAGAAALPG
ncbi:ester cyclase [Novosphingobium sp.]|uniref:ester cyclase n=1 Tax=Novosphingobium sp. TaxID=1874826 RepID=UPI0038BC4DDC